MRWAHATDKIRGDLVITCLTRDGKGKLKWGRGFWASFWVMGRVKETKRTGLLEEKLRGRQIWVEENKKRTTLSRPKLSPNAGPVGRKR